jgi:WD40 repeat protein
MNSFDILAPLRTWPRLAWPGRLATRRFWRDGFTCHLARAWSVLIVLALLSHGRASAGPANLANATAVNEQPRIKPDYALITIPPNIAPLNFEIQEPGASFLVRLQGSSGEPIEISSANPRILIPTKAWRKLLQQNRGEQLRIDVFAEEGDQQWKRYLTITNTIAPEEIDPVMIYRKIHPAHSTWRSMGLYQRDLTSFDEKPFLENSRFANDCCHCHMLRGNDPNAATIVIRSSHYQNSLLVISNGVAEAIRGSVGFVAWHPKGSVMASSFSKPRLMLHTARNDMRDIAELEGWIGYFQLGSDTVKKVPGLSDNAHLRTFPFWSPDGRYLYYCCAPNPWTNMALVTATSHTMAKYDLMRLSYDLEHDRWGQPELILAAAELGSSVAQPRMSPDGHWIFFCAIPYGCWPTYDSTSDIYGIDLVAGQAAGKYTARKLELNSSECESWLSWSSNSRWVVFSSKRISPLFNRPHIAYVSPNGQCGKPFILPQEDPEFYDSLLKTFTIPTLAKGPITVPESDLVDAIKHSSRRPLKMPTAQVENPSEH